MNQSDRKRNYDKNQLVNERIERLGNEKGWSELFIPEIQKQRNEAQEELNKRDCDHRKADYLRGKLEVYDMILGYVETKMRHSKTNMKKAATTSDQHLLAE